MQGVREVKIVEIEKYVMANGGDFRQWYVGIAEDPRSRLFTDHGVAEVGGAWIIRDAGSRNVADQIEEYFTEVRNMQGGPGGGSEGSIYVYAYLITTGTNQEN